jgi:hypothetical protein
MKSFAAAFTILTVLCFLQVDAQSIEPAPADKAVVYFVRTSSMGFAINFTYVDSALLIGKFSGQGYIRYTCDPGKHLLWARSENRDFVEADVEAGKIYFIEAIVTMGAMKAAVQLDPTNPKDEKAMKRILKIISKNQAETFSDQELKAEQIKKQDAVRKGLEKYATDKQKGKKMNVLDRSMFYSN